MNKELVEQMKVALASTFAFYLKAHNFHWNVEGPNFPQYHSFFETIYTDAFNAVDAIAEEIRALDSYAPGSFDRYSELSEIEDQSNVPGASAMVKELFLDNGIMISVLEKAEKLATENKKVGLSNFLQDRIDKHYKHNWMLKSILKG